MEFCAVEKGNHRGPSYANIHTSLVYIDESKTNPFKATFAIENEKMKICADFLACINGRKC